MSDSSVPKANHYHRGHVITSSRKQCQDDLAFTILLFWEKLINCIHSRLSEAKKNSIRSIVETRSLWANQTNDDRNKYVARQNVSTPTFNYTFIYRSPPPLPCLLVKYHIQSDRGLVKLQIYRKFLFFG